MKGTSLHVFLILFTFCFSINGQEQARFNLPRQNVMYAGIPNSILLYDFSKGDSLVASDSVIVLRGDEFGAFKVIPKNVSEELILQIRNKKGKLKSELSVRVLGLPDPKVTLFGKVEGLLSRNQIANAKELSVELSCFNVSAPVNIRSFTLTVNTGAGLKSIKVSGSRFNSEAKQLLQTLPRGSRVHIEEIRVKMPDGQIVKVPSLIFKVK